MRMPGSCNPASRHYVRDSIGVLMLPHVQRLPTDFTKADVVASIPGDVGSELRRPPFAIRSGTNAVLRAGVPEAAINEHGKSKAGHNEVRPPGEVPAVEPEPYPACVQSPAQFHLWAGVADPLTRHEVADLIRRSLGPVTTLSHPEFL
jgi:hypothetical protein